MLAVLLTWSLGFAVFAAEVFDPPNGVPYATNGFLAIIDFDGDTQVDASYVLEVDRNLVQFYFLNDERATYLAPSKKAAVFPEEGLISTNSLTVNEAFGFTGVAPDLYAWRFFFMMGFPHYGYNRFSGGQFPTLTNALVGLRVFLGDNFYHHAWIRLARPDNVAGTPFQVVAYDYNPLPDEPIQAGIPPPAPVLSSTMDDQGNLVLSWPERYVPYYKLQTRPDLPPVPDWADVGTRDDHTHTAPIAAEQAYYRLTRR